MRYIWTTPSGEVAEYLTSSRNDETNAATALNTSAAMTITAKIRFEVALPMPPLLTLDVTKPRIHLTNVELERFVRLIQCASEYPSET